MRPRQRGAAQRHSAPRSALPAAAQRRAALPHRRRRPGVFRRGPGVLRAPGPSATPCHGFLPLVCVRPGQPGPAGPAGIGVTSAAPWRCCHVSPGQSQSQPWQTTQAGSTLGSPGRRPGHPTVTVKVTRRAGPAAATTSSPSHSPSLIAPSRAGRGRGARTQRRRPTVGEARAQWQAASARGPAGRVGGEPERARSGQQPRSGVGCHRRAGRGSGERERVPADRRRHR